MHLVRLHVDKTGDKWPPIGGNSKPRPKHLNGYCGKGFPGYQHHKPAKLDKASRSLTSICVVCGRAILRAHEFSTYWTGAR
jgi:hypothetical protein